MKKTFLFIVLSLNISSLWAQVEVGIKAGGMLSGIATQGISLISSDEAPEVKASYLVGGAMKLPLPAQLNLLAELLYANKGYRASLEPFSVKDNFHYLSLPILLQYQPTQRWGLAVGPEVSYLLSAFQKNIGRSRLDNIKPFDVALDLDVAYSVLENLSFSLRYNLGLYDVTKRFEATLSDGTFISIDSKAYNRTLQLSALYRF